MNWDTGLPSAILSTIWAVGDPGSSRSVMLPAIVPNSAETPAAATAQTARGRRTRRADRSA